MKNLKCEKCQREIGKKEIYMALEREVSRRSGEVIFCKECGGILEEAENILIKYREIKKEFYEIAAKVWKRNNKRL